MLSQDELVRNIFSILSAKTQQSVADKLGVSQSLIKEWKSGRCAPRLPELAKVVEVSGCSWDDLLGDQVAELTPSASEPATELSADQQAILTAMGKMMNAMGEILARAGKDHVYAHAAAEMLTEAATAVSDQVKAG